ncbi:MAG: hypothetical protein ACXABY_20170 [Candidatus Thorarchaeota archaeon]|jgi:hypothetical protein
MTARQGIMVALFRDTSIRFFDDGSAQCGCTVMGYTRGTGWDALSKKYKLSAAERNYLQSLVAAARAKLKMIEEEKENSFDAQTVEAGDVIQVEGQDGYLLVVQLGAQQLYTVDPTSGEVENRGITIEFVTRIWKRRKAGYGTAVQTAFTTVAPSAHWKEVYAKED